MALLRAAVALKAHFHLLSRPSRAGLTMLARTESRPRRRCPRSEHGSNRARAPLAIDAFRQFACENGFASRALMVRRNTRISVMADMHSYEMRRRVAGCRLSKPGLIPRKPPFSAYQPSGSSIKVPRGVRCSQEKCAWLPEPTAYRYAALQCWQELRHVRFASGAIPGAVPAHNRVVCVGKLMMKRRGPSGAFRHHAVVARKRSGPSGLTQVIRNLRMTTSADFGIHIVTLRGA